MENPIFSSTDQAPHSCSNAHWYVGGLKLKINLNLWNTQSVPQPMFNTRMFKIQWVIARPKRTLIKKSIYQPSFSSCHQIWKYITKLPLTSLHKKCILLVMSNVVFIFCSVLLYDVPIFCHQMHIICVNIFLESNLWRWLMVDKNHVTNQTFPILSICGSCLQSINQKSPGSGFVTNSLFHSSSRIRPLKIQFVRGKIGGDAKQFMKR